MKDVSGRDHSSMLIPVISSVVFGAGCFVVVVKLSAATSLGLYDLLYSEFLIQYLYQYLFQNPLYFAPVFLIPSALLAAAAAYIFLETTLRFNKNIEGETGEKKSILLGVISSILMSLHTVASVITIIFFLKS